MNQHEDSEAALLSRAVGGEPGALEELHARVYEAALKATRPRIGLALQKKLYEYTGRGESAALTVVNQTWTRRRVHLQLEIWIQSIEGGFEGLLRRVMKLVDWEIKTLAAKKEHAIDSLLTSRLLFERDQNGVPRPSGEMTKLAGRDSEEQVKECQREMMEKIGPEKAEIWAMLRLGGLSHARVSELHGITVDRVRGIREKADKVMKACLARRGLIEPDGDES